MKKIYNIIMMVSVIIFSLSSCIKEGDLELDPVPEIGFTYTSEGLTLTFESTGEGISDVSWTISDGATGTGESLEHTFDKPDSYWISMTGTVHGEEQTVSTKIIVAKAALVSMDDNSIADWDNVNYSDFQFAGGSSIIKGKLDYDANYVYFYMELDGNVNPKATVTSHILSMAIDNDANLSTGLDFGGLGAEYLLEGQIYGGEVWTDFYNYTGGDWWENITDPTFADGMTIGHSEVDGGVLKIEWAFSRKTFGINSTSFGLYWNVYDEDWADADIMEYNGDSAILINMDKE